MSQSRFETWVACACRELKSKQFYLKRGMDEPLEFYKKLDSNVHITAFKNGVYDVRTRKFYRPGAIPADAIGRYSTDYDFIGDEDGLPVSQEDKDMMDEIEREVIDKIFPDGRGGSTRRQEGSGLHPYRRLDWSRSSSSRWVRRETTNGKSALTDQLAPEAGVGRILLHTQHRPRHGRTRQG